MLLDCKEKFNYDYSTMGETVTGPTPEVKTAPSPERVAQTVKKAVGAKAKEHQRAPIVTDTDRALKLYGDIQDFKNGDRSITISRADPDNPEDRDIVLPERKMVDEEGNSVTLAKNEWRVAEVVGVDDEGNLQCMIENVKDPDKHGLLPVAVDRQVVLEGQMLAQEQQIAEAFDDDTDAQDVFKLWVASHPQSEGKMPPADAPTEDKLNALDEKYDKMAREADDKPQAKEVSESVTRAHEVIATEIKKIQDLLKAPDLPAEQREAAQALLWKLRVAQLTKHGSVGVAFTYDALKVMRGDDDPLVLELKDTAVAAEKELSGMLKGATSEEQFKAWATTANTEGGMSLLLKDSGFMDLLADAKGGDICKAMFGKELSTKKLQKMFDKIDGIPPGLKKALESGDRASILMILLQILAGVVLVPVVAAGAVGVGGLIGGAKVLEAASGQR
jgi:hypothetical protein